MDIKTTRMFEYIKETPVALRNIINNRKEITGPFVEKFQNVQIDQIYIVGSGTSYHGGLAAKPLIEEVLGVKVCVMYPILFKDQEKVLNKNTLVIGVSQGGQSMSTTGGLVAAKEMGLRSAALSANKDARIFGHAEISVDLAVGDEFCGAKTKGYAGTICTLMMLGMELALAKGILDEARAEGYLARMEKVIDNLPGVTEASVSWYERIKEDIKLAKKILVTGYEANYPNVLEGALKILETVRQAVSGYELEEFLHGIYNSVKEDTYILYLGSAGRYKERILRLKSIMAEKTEHNYMITATGLENPAARDLTADFTEDPMFSVWEYIIPLQVLSAFAPLERGINPDIPSDPSFHQKMGSK